MTSKCPKPETLLEFVSIPKDISLVRRLSIRAHARNCKQCTANIASIKTRWETFLTPEPEITSSLLRVYSRLQNDETLILKGWKLKGARQQKDVPFFLLRQGWLFRGGVSLGLAGLLAVFAVNQWNIQDRGEDLAKDARLVQETSAASTIPLAQIRIEEKNRVKVHYVEPQLLQSIEFETTGGAR